MNVATRQRRDTDDCAVVIDSDRTAIIAAQSPQTGHDAVGAEEGLGSGVHAPLIGDGGRAGHVAEVVYRGGAARRAAQGSQIKKRGPIESKSVRYGIAF